ncbi:MAG: aldo/keto reductase [Lactobacillaceae bacterium]|nr:aldo/keto reductase [Lactobacillaceae bacterium]
MSKVEKDYKLSNGVKIPSIGFGTWQIEYGAATVNAVKEAIDLGYSHIDTAAIYGNEVSVGEAINQSDVKRKDLFITTKLWNSDRGYDNTMKAFAKSFQALQVDYIDLYLVHWPATKGHREDWAKVNSSTWKAFEELYKDGVVKSIGVSNFMPHHLEPLMADAKIAPMVNQIEFHPGFMQMETLDFCRKNNMLVEAWSPLGQGEVLKNPDLMKIAEKYKKSVAQICIRWCLQNGTLPLPKSVTSSRIKQNLDVYDFEISAEDMKSISALPYIGGSGLHPDKVKF